MGLLKRYPALFMGLAITLVFLWLGMVRVELIDSLELKFYDIRMGLIAQPETQSDIVLVTIDDDSLDKLGRWPWPRSLLAQGLDKINQGAPRLIGMNILFSEEEESSGLKVLATLQNLYNEKKLQSSSVDAFGFYQAMLRMEREIDTDAILAKTLDQLENVVLPVVFLPSVAVEGNLQPEAALKELSINNVRKPKNAQVPKASEILLPIPVLMSQAAGMGHISLSTDADGKARREALLYGYRGLYIPSFALELAALAQGIPHKNISAVLGDHLQLGQTRIPLTYDSTFLVTYKGGRNSFKRYPYYDVITDKIPKEVFKNKIVLVSVAAAGIINPLATPTDAHMPLGEYTAHTLWSLLQGTYIEKPSWNETAELAAILLLGLVIALALPKMRALSAGLTFLILAAGLLGGATWLFVAKGLWVTTSYPLLQLVTGYIGVVSLKYFVTESDKEKVEGESAESNRMLGISFQEQGRLDLAFDKFRRCPVDQGMKDILYSLAQDYERKRQFQRAVAVYEHIEAHDPGYKDVKARKSRLVQGGETVVLGSGAYDPLLSTTTDTRPTLGRYEIVKQLGKGAMGIVYLGMDPRINRTTAIKTFQFPEEADPDQTASLKKRFFQEAESAGTLTHPNIVTIYDAGEEQDLAYIAMEYLEGHDLTRYTKNGALLGLQKVVDYMGDVAEALDYAHQKGIVHRDVKPANIMLLDSGVIKITDFGIARITASSQTQTGVVKGTPHFMSPEQISGEKVDGRSDIFSLGVVLFQLLTGKPPFTGDSLASLMHKIMNTPHPDARTLNPKIPKAVIQIIDKAMTKERDKRYQTAGEMARHLRFVSRKLAEALSRKNAPNPTDKA